MTSPVTREVVPDVTLPAARNTGRVEVREIRMLPGTAPGLHVHNGPVFGSIVAGSVDATEEGVAFLAHYLLGPSEQAEITFPEA